MTGKDRADQSPQKPLPDDDMPSRRDDPSSPPFQDPRVKPLGDRKKGDKPPYPLTS